MRYTLQHAGKWVAVKNDRVLATAEEFALLQRKIAGRKDAANVRFSLVPKGMICTDGRLRGVSAARQ
jgi:hypothetical protein